MPLAAFRRNPHDREIARLAVPALGQLGAEPLYVMVDTAVVGHLGTEQLGGLAVAGTLLTIAFWLFNFLSYGTTAAVARLHGAGDDVAAANQAIQGMWLASLIGLGLVVFGFVTAEVGVSLMGASEAVTPHALTYLRISLLGVPFILVTLVGMGYMRGLQDTATPLVVAVAGNVVNLVVELFLIYGLDWGIAASAWSTVLAQVGSAVFFVVVVLRAAGRLGVSLEPERGHLRDLALVGRDLFVRTGALLLALGLATAVAARLGSVDLAAHQVAYQLWIFLALTLDAVAIAAQAMVGRALGAGDAAAARAASKRMLEWGVAAGVAFAALVLLLRPVLPDVFTDDPAVADLLERVLVLVAVFQPINAAVFVLDGILIGAGDFRFLAVAMVVAAVAVFCPVALGVVTLDLTLEWLWIGLGVLMGARLVGNWSRFSSEAWQVVGPRRTRAVPPA